MVVSESIRSVVLSILLITAAGTQAQQPDSNAGNTLSADNVRPMGDWVEFRTARYGSAPILLHLRSGYERAVLMPEPIRLLDSNQTLPGCAVEIDTDVIGFFPTRNFVREPIRFVGLQSGSVYELRVRASPEGIRQPLQILR